MTNNDCDKGADPRHWPQKKGFEMRKFWRGEHWVLLALAVIVVLFISSSMTYREQTTVPLLERLLASEPFAGHLARIHFNYGGTEVSISSLGYFKFVEWFLRKGAHVGTYFLIGLFGYLGLRQPVRGTWLRVVLTILSAAGLAAFDEFHQMLTGDRSPMFQDVMLDTTAATLAVCLVLIILAIRQRRHAH